MEYINWISVLIWTGLISEFYIFSLAGKSDWTIIIICFQHSCSTTGGPTIHLNTVKHWNPMLNLGELGNKYNLQKLNIFFLSDGQVWNPRKPARPTFVHSKIVYAIVVPIRAHIDLIKDPLPYLLVNQSIVI